MDVETAIRRKRAVRDFSDEPIGEDDLRAILDAGRRAQSSENSQPWTFVVVRDRATLRALAECGQYAGHLAGAAVAVALVAGAREDDFDLGQAAAHMQLAAEARGIGSCIASMWEPDRAREILGLPPDRRFDQAISFGWPAASERERERRRGGRRPLADITRYERW